MINPTEYTGNIGLISKTNDEQIPLTGVFVEAAIIGRSSKVKITQKYKNNGKSAVEAVYKFPLTGECLRYRFSRTVKRQNPKG